MAEVGKGDPRWIVQDRTDGANVNSWHWTEKDITPWATEKLAQIIEGHSFDMSSGDIQVKVTKDSILGDCGVMNRKKKLVFYYQWGVTMSWKGTLFADTEKETAISGKMKLTDVDQDEDDFDVECSASAPSKGSNADAAVIVSHVKKSALKYCVSLLSLLQQEIKVFMQQGCDLSSPTSRYSASETPPAPSDFTDALSDVEETVEEESSPVPAFSVSDPRSSRINVSLIKETTDPMGLLLEPNTLELLGIKDETAGSRSLAKWCVGLFLSEINGVVVENMEGVKNAAGGQTELSLVFVDAHLNAGRYQESVEMNERLVDQKVGGVVVPVELRRKFLQNRAVSRLMKNVAFKSNILTNAAVDDAKLLENDEEQLYAKCWVLLKAHSMSTDSATQRQYTTLLLQHCLSSTPTLPIFHALMAQLPTFAAVHTAIPMETLMSGHQDAILIFVRRLKTLTVTGDIRYLKDAYAPHLRKHFKRHENVEIANFARNVGKIQRS